VYYTSRGGQAPLGCTAQGADVSEDLIVVVGYSKAEKVKLPVRAAWLDEHYSRAVSVTPALLVSR
jgi:hypothetical protein